eukprot:TRINITY_DN1900_c2_g2_i1.p1 TRINITY_DN1900_c2_g2~~TRINITY_DN1900_c2_g2_i1.p1  ORF type:complete len:382 (+),score=25.50 TRINITY_DN1900_c2_g2_i1:66-1211(+)
MNLAVKCAAVLANALGMYCAWYVMNNGTGGLGVWWALGVWGVVWAAIGGIAEKLRPVDTVPEGTGSVASSDLREMMIGDWGESEEGGEGRVRFNLEPIEQEERPVIEEPRPILKSKSKLVSYPTCQLSDTSSIAPSLAPAPSVVAQGVSFAVILTASLLSCRYIPIHLFVLLMEGSRAGSFLITRRPFTAYMVISSFMSVTSVVMVLVFLKPAPLGSIPAIVLGITGRVKESWDAPSVTWLGMAVGSIPVGVAGLVGAAVLGSDMSFPGTLFDFGLLLLSACFSCPLYHVTAYYDPGSFWSEISPLLAFFPSIPLGLLTFCDDTNLHLALFLSSFAFIATVFVGITTTLIQTKTCVPRVAQQAEVSSEEMPQPLLPGGSEV